MRSQGRDLLVYIKFENSMNDIKKAFNLNGFSMYFSQISRFFYFKHFFIEFHCKVKGM